MRGVGLRRSGSLGRREDLPTSAEINVTSLVDVAFTLLVIFIITAPILQGGVDVTLPQAEVRPITAMEDLFIVSVDAGGTVYWEETAVTIEEFESSVGQLAQVAGTQQVFIKGDDAARYGIVLRVIAAVQAAGIPTSLVAEPRPAQRRR